MLLVLATMLTCVPMLASAEETSVPYVKPVPKTVTTTETVKMPKEVTDGWYMWEDTTITHQHQLPMESVMTRTEPVAPADIESSGNFHTFTTFEDLKKLAAGTYDSYAQAEYNGTEDLVIGEDLTLPANLHLYAYQSTVIIPKGVTLILNASLYTKNLTVNGKAYLEYTSVSGKLTVNGTLYANSTIRMGSTATVSGVEKIVFANEWTNIDFSVTPQNQAELTAAISAAKNAPSERFHYEIDLCDFTVSKNTNVPANCQLDVYGDSFTLKAGCTLTVNDYMYINCPAAIKGTLKNNGQISINTYNSSAKLTFSGDGKYSGRGIIHLGDSDNLISGNADIKKYIAGLSLDNFEITEYNDYSHYWELRYIVGLTKLKAPTNLSWGTYYNHYSYNASTDKYELKDIKMPGVASFKPTAAKATYTNVRFYNAKDNSNVLGGAYGWWWDGAAYDATAMLSQAALCKADIPSGTYYFTVTNEGDYVNYYSSMAKSAKWTYTKPSSKVGKPSDLSWVGTNATFKAPSTTTYVGGYEIEVYYSPTKDGTPQIYGNMWNYSGSSETQMNVQWIVLNKGAGYYSFRIRALSSNITKRNNGAWSAMSKAKYLEPLVLKVTNRASDGKPSLSWNKIDGAAKYQVWRATKQNGTYTLVKTTTNTSFVNTGAKAGTKYFYVVQALNSNGNSLQSSDNLSIRCDLARPNVTATNVASSGKIKLTWKKIEGATKYEVYRATSKNGNYTKLGSTTNLSYTNTSAVAGKTYYYKVKAIHSNSDANSAFSAVDSRLCDLKRPEISIKLNDAGKPRISWTKIDGAAKYQVYRATSKSGTYKLMGTTTNGYFVNKNAEAGTTYYYKVRAVHSNTNANSAFSAVKSITAG